ncbi:DUF6706 family protein [Changchengzhania lutea]|uniref:DUF6706 family protein n=1 Tax=Changchengzhania lutea TaxID=2049305 RepID=UPI00115C9CCE|nr:DUF6706 family protein [Changchengzhania lutea]
MTVLEAIQANPVFIDVSVNHINTVLSSRSIDGSATYTESSLKDVELVTADLYMDKVLLPKFKEGQLSVEYNTSLLKNRALALYNKYEDSKALEYSPQPINVGVSDASNDY